MNNRLTRYVTAGLFTIVLCSMQWGCTNQPEEGPKTAGQASPQESVPSASPTPQASPTPSATAEQSQTPAASQNVPGQAGESGGSSEAEVAKPEPIQIITLPPGSSIRVITTSAISTKTSKAGDKFVATLARPIGDGDWTIARKGATVEGVVLNSNPGGRVKGVASLSVTLKRLALVNGRSVDISTGSYIRNARTTIKKDAAKVGIGAGAGAVIGAIAGGKKGAAIGAGVGAGAGTADVLLTRGDPAVIPSEAELGFRLKSPVTVTMKK